MIMFCIELVLILLNVVYVPIHDQFTLLRFNSFR
jgi:hypothetical protein